MKLAELKRELQNMVAVETNIDVLQSVHKLLKQSEIAYQKELTRRTLKAEDDIQNGRLFTPEEALQRILQQRA